MGLGVRFQNGQLESPEISAYSDWATVGGARDVLGVTTKARGTVE